MFNLLPTYKKVSLIASIIGTVLMTGGVILSFVLSGTVKSGSFIEIIVSALTIIGFVGTVVSYVTGGFIEALKTSFHIGKWGFLIGSFPVNIFVGLGTIMIALYAMIALPIIPVWKSCKNYLGTHIVIKTSMEDESESHEDTQKMHQDAA